MVTDLLMCKENEGYVSNPDKGVATYTRGVAVDLTLVDLKTGKELEMGTEFDSFDLAANHSFAFEADDNTRECRYYINDKTRDSVKISKIALKNRAILAGIMSVAGFSPLPSEWWHYQIRLYSNYPDYDNYPKKTAKDVGLKNIY